MAVIKEFTQDLVIKQQVVHINRGTNPRKEVSVPTLSMFSRVFRFLPRKTTFCLIKHSNAN